MALSVSELSCQVCDGLPGLDVDFRVCARPVLVEAGLTNYACKSAPVIMSHFNNLLGIPYQLPKMDLIAPPNKAGAMENFGLMIFTETYLLIDPKSTSTLQGDTKIYLIIEPLHNCHI